MLHTWRCGRSLYCNRKTELGFTHVSYLKGYAEVCLIMYIYYSIGRDRRWQWESLEAITVSRGYFEFKKSEFGDFLCL